MYCGMKSEMILDIFVDFVNWLEMLVNRKGIILIVKVNFKCMVSVFFLDFELIDRYLL